MILFDGVRAWDYYLRSAFEFNFFALMLGHSWTFLGYALGFMVSWSNCQRDFRLGNGFSSVVSWWV